MTPAPSLQDVIKSVEADASDSEPINRLRSAAAMARDLADVSDAALGYFVDQARRAGHSWSEIGDALGVTKQAAQQRHTADFGLRPTFERFTPRARNVLFGAEVVARDWAQDQIKGEHILLGLYSEPDGMAAQILTEAGFNSETAVASVAELAQKGPGAPEGEIPLGPEAKAVLRAALASALEYRHNYIGTEHLLLGTALDGGVGATALARAGLTSDAIKSATSEKLEGYMKRAKPQKATKKK